MHLVVKGGAVYKHAGTTGANPAVSFTWVPGEQAATYHRSQRGGLQGAMEIAARQANLVSGAGGGLRKDDFSGGLVRGEGGGDGVERSRCS